MCTYEDNFAIFLGSQMASCVDAYCISSHPREISELLKRSEQMVQWYISTFQHTPTEVQPKPRRSGPEKLMGDHEQLLFLQIIVRNLGIYLHEMQERLYERLGVAVNSSTLCRTL